MTHRRSGRWPFIRPRDSVLPMEPFGAAPLSYEYWESVPLGSPFVRTRDNVEAECDATPIAGGTTQGHYGWSRSRIVENRAGNKKYDGVRNVANLRVVRRYGFLPRGISLDADNEQKWPLGVDFLASRNCLHHYCRIPSRADAAAFLHSTFDPVLGVSTQPVAVEVYVDDKWYEPVNGVIEAVDAVATKGRLVHYVPLNAFGRVDSAHQPVFQFVNSWGEEWGNDGTGYLTEDAYSKYVISGWRLCGHGSAGPVPTTKGVFAQRWDHSVARTPGSSVHGREIVVGISGERLAWAFARESANFLEVDEFFVWPTDRRNGYGTALATMVLELAAELGKPVRVWVPFNDAEPQNRQTLDVAMRLLGLSLHPSPSRAAAFVGLVEPSPADLNEPELPPRPTATRHSLLSDVALPAVAYGAANATEDSPAVYRVWYGTTRSRADGESVTFTNERATETSYGSVDVNIPRSHRFGSIGSSWLARWFRGVDDRLEVATIRSYAADAFAAELGASYSDSEGDSLLFIHGYNVDFEEAAIRAAQIGYDLKVPGETAFFSWPSRGTLAGYPADAASIQASERQIAEFLELFADAVSPGRVHIIAHSMGNRGLARACGQVVARLGAESANRFGQIMLAAPDIDVAVFKDLVPAYLTLAERTTLYASPADHAVAWSRWLHDYPRAGFTPPVTVIDGVDTVVVPRFNLLSLGHSYYAEAASVLADMDTLMRTNQPPDQRLRLSEQVDGDGRYWAME